MDEALHLFDLCKMNMSALHSLKFTIDVILLSRPSVVSKFGKKILISISENDSEQILECAMNIFHKLHYTIKYMLVQQQIPFFSELNDMTERSRKLIEEFKYDDATTLLKTLNKMINEVRDYMFNNIVSALELEK